MQANKSEPKARMMAAATRRFYASAAMAMAIFMLMLAPVFLKTRTGSPTAMVQAQVVHGEKIASADPMPAVPASALAVFSNSIAITAPANSASNSDRIAGQFVPKTFTVGNVSVTLLPKLAAADSNSLPDIIELGGEKYLNLTFAKLSSYPFKVTPEVEDATKNPAVASQRTREQVPAAVQAFGERLAAVNGFMLPIEVNGGLTTDFLLMRNQSACCYGIMPRVNEWVIVQTGKGVQPVMDVPVTAIGTFHVGELRQNGHLAGIYTLECDRLLPAK